MYVTLPPGDSSPRRSACAPPSSPVRRAITLAIRSAKHFFPSSAFRRNPIQRSRSISLRKVHDVPPHGVQVAQRMQPRHEVARRPSRSVGTSPIRDMIRHARHHISGCRHSTPDCMLDRRIHRPMMYGTTSSSARASPVQQAPTLCFAAPGSIQLLDRPGVILDRAMQIKRQVFRPRHVRSAAPVQMGNSGKFSR